MTNAARALAALALAAAVVVAAATPALAAAPEVTWRTPSAGWSSAASAFTVDATVRMPNSGTLRGNATLSFVSPENHPVPAPTEHPADNQASRVITHAVSFPWNGPYTARITAVGRDGMLDQTEEQGGGSVDFAVDAPPVAPQNVRTSVDEQTRKVTVSWALNAEPDMKHYEVQRQLGAESWQRVTVTGKTASSVVDSAPASAGGSYRYRVFAIREAAAAGEGIASGPSATSTAKVPAPPVTTTTTTASHNDEDGTDTDDDTTGDTTRTTTRTGTTTGESGTGSHSRGSGRSSAPPLATSGKVDLSGFAALLEEARAAGEESPAVGDNEEDGGFSERLPFGARQRQADTSGAEDDDGTMVVSTPISDDGGDRLRSMGFLAGGLLATVLLMHVLWVRAELHRAEQLEALAPDDAVGEAPPAPGEEARPTAGDPWGRHLATALARFHARPPTRRPAAADTAPAGDGERDADRAVIG